MACSGNPVSLHERNWLGSSDWPPPLDARDLAVRLETAGVSDQVAREKYGFQSTWEMAQQCFKLVSENHEASQRVGEELSAWKEYLKGLLAALPLAVCWAAMFGLQFSLWGGPFNLDTATAVGLGTVLSFVFTGGFIQSMARQGMFYAGTLQYRRYASCLWQWFRWGLLGLTGGAVLALLCNAYFAWLPAHVMATAVAFQVALGLLWLTLSMLHTQGKYLLMTASVAAGVGAVFVLHRIWGLGLLASQLAGTSLAVSLGILASWARTYSLRRRDSALPPQASLPRTAWLVWPYFLYGCLYYLFLWLDRLLAWTAGTRSARMPAEFRGYYEVGLDIALLAFVLQAGWASAATARLHRGLQGHLQRYRLRQVGEFNTAVVSSYFRYLAIISLAMLAVSALVYSAVCAIGMPGNAVTRWALVWGLLAYPLVLVGLWNASLLFALSRPSPLIASVAAACVVNLGAGYALSRAGGYQHAVLGLVSGAVVLAVSSSLGAVRVLKEADHCYVAAGI